MRTRAIGVLAAVVAMAPMLAHADTIEFISGSSTVSKSDPGYFLFEAKYDTDTTLSYVDFANSVEEAQGLFDTDLKFESNGTVARFQFYQDPAVLGYGNGKGLIAYDVALNLSRVGDLSSASSGVLLNGQTRPPVELTGTFSLSVADGAAIVVPPPSPVPLPSTASLLGVALLGTGGLGYARRRAKTA